MNIKFGLKLKERWQPRIERLDMKLGGALGVVNAAIRQFGLENGSQAAAGMAFYSVFSLFPLLALSVTFASMFSSPQRVAGVLLSLLSPVFPVSHALIEEIIRRFLETPVASSVISLVILVWSASGAFAILVTNINQAWDNARPRNFLQQRLLGLGFLAILLVLLIVILMLTTLVDIISRLDPLFNQGWMASPYWGTGTELFTFLLTFLIFLMIYRHIPRAPVHYSEAFWGALLVSAAWYIISALFTLFIASSQGRYDLLYGSLAAFAIMMVWMYLNNLMILFGAHLSAAISRRKRETETPVITVKENAEYPPIERGG